MEPVSEPPDPVAYFGSDDDIVDYINCWMSDGSPREIARALGDVVRSKGMTEIPPKSGEEPQALYARLSHDGPTLEIVAAVLDALGLEMRVRKKAA